MRHSNGPVISNATSEPALLKGEAMKILIVGGGIGASGRTAIAYGSYDGAKTRRSSWGMRFWRWCARCSARSRQREALLGLDGRLLEDIGVTRQQANAEAAKPFWK
jgi:uncharacterized protein YjiS (DUF1127 family)